MSLADEGGSNLFAVRVLDLSFKGSHFLHIPERAAPEIVRSGLVFGSAGLVAQGDPLV